MSTCLLCHSYFQDIYSWKTLFAISDQDPVCMLCMEKFEIIAGDICEICGRPFSSIHGKYRDGEICIDCSKWNHDIHWKDVLVKNRSVYIYNEYGKEILSLFKFRGDYILSNAFRSAFRKAFTTHFSTEHIIVPIPLSTERLYERGFNQANALAELLDRPIQNSLTRTHHEKQSKKNRSERIKTENVFKVSDSSSIQDKDILLIDDIYTTGTTLRHAAKTLLEANAKTVSSLTLMRG